MGWDERDRNIAFSKAQLDGISLETKRRGPSDGDVPQVLPAMVSSIQAVHGSPEASPSICDSLSAAMPQPWPVPAIWHREVLTSYV